MSLNRSLHGGTEMNITDDQQLQQENGYYEIMDIAYAINKYYLWVILAIGLPGNFATIITICRLRSLGSFTLYVVALAVMDNVAIAVKVMIYLFHGRVSIGAAGCKAVQFFGSFSPTYANWILVLMAMERLIAVRYPLKIQKYLNCRRSLIAIGSTGGIIAGLYAPILWTSTFNSTDKTCYQNVNDFKELSVIIGWINILFFAFFPFIVLIFCNLFIIRIIRHSFRVRTALTQAPHHSLKRKSSCYDSSIQRQIMLMLFTATLVFVVLIFPICAFNVANKQWLPGAETRHYAIKYLCYQLAYVLCDSTHAVNFLLYFLSARKFRNQFLRMSSCNNLSPRHRSSSGR